MKRVFLVMVLCWSGLSCGHNDPGEDHGDILSSPGSLLLSQERHAAGWGRSECFTCHAQKNLHLEDRADGIELDIEAIQEQAREGGEAGCPTCHGNNGL